MGRMRILDGSGDTILDWDVASEDSVAEAASVFLSLQAEHRVAFARPRGAAADDAALVKAFDPTVEEIIWVRPLAGG